MAAEIFRFEDFELDRGAYELRRAGRSVRLERIPLDLLFLLVERHGQLVTRQEIVDRVWGKEVFLDTEHGINTAARKIRLALSDNPEAPRFVLTVPAKGYRFVASVEKTEPAVAAALAVAVEPEKPAATEPPRDRGHWRILIPALAFLGALVTMSFFHFHRAQALTEKDTIVLADFANSTGEVVFDDTLKQALSVQLSQSPFLNILSDKKMSETLQMMGRSAEERVGEKTGLEICQRTQSVAVLAGSIARLGSQYVIGINAMDCRKGDFLAQEQMRAGSKEEVLKALDHAAREFRGKLGESLGSIQKFDTPIASARTVPYTSYQAIVAFADQNGRPVTLPDQIAFSPPSFRVGQKVRVFYDPQNPQHAMIDRGRKNFIIPGICLVFGGLIVLGSTQRLTRRLPVDSSGASVKKTFRIA